MEKALCVSIDDGSLIFETAWSERICSKISTFPDQKYFVFVDDKQRISVCDATNLSIWKRYDESRRRHLDLIDTGKLYPVRCRGDTSIPPNTEIINRLDDDNPVSLCIINYSHATLLVYSSPIGIKIVDAYTNKLVSILGYGEGSIRFFAPSLHQHAAQGTSSTVLSLGQKMNRVFAFHLDLTDGQTFHNDTQVEMANYSMPSPRVVKTKSTISITINVEKDLAAVIRTNFGDIEVDMFPKIAPMACENFIHLSKQHYFDNCIFHRIIRSFMIQTGDPTGTGMSGQSCWKRPFPDEIELSKVKNDDSMMLCMANNGPDSNGSQFFITTVKAEWLDGKHTIFGKVRPKSYEIVHSIEHVKTDKLDRPLAKPPPMIVQIKIL